MKLNFEIMQDIGVGNYPDLLHMYDNEAQAIYLKDGLMYGKTTETPLGEWGEREFEEERKILNLEELSHFEINKLGGFGAVGVVKSKDSHKLLIYEFQHDISEYLNEVRIRHSIENPISNFSLDLENAKNPNEEYEGNIALTENDSMINPGAKVILRFGAGDELPRYAMGTFYVDRTNYTVLNEVASIDGRNLIGKALKDQTLDEKHEFWYSLNTEILRELLRGANIPSNKIIIQPSAIKNSYKFTPNNTVFNAVEEILSNMIGWQIKELVDGTIVIGDKNFVSFTRTGQYVFNRNKDIFSRQILSDDIDSYGRICVHSKDFIYTTYRDVETYSIWNLQSKKTLYVQVAEGSSISLINDYADLLAEQMKNVGKIESFTGPYRPFLICGDEAIIVDGATRSLGLITEIEHIAGKQGFYTNFTVDSGGKLGKGRISDFIRRISGDIVGAGVKVGSSDIQGEEDVNLAPLAIVTQKTNSAFYFEEHANPYRLTDRNMDFYYGSYGSFGGNEIIFDFGQRAIINKIILYDGGRVGSDVQRGYEFQIWNSSFWVTVVTQEGLIGELNAETSLIWRDRIYTHELDSIEASKVKLVLTGQTHYGIKEVEIFGKM